MDTFKKVMDIKKEKEKTHQNGMDNYGTKLEILLDQ